MAPAMRHAMPLRPDGEGGKRKPGSAGGEEMAAGKRHETAPVDDRAGRYLYTPRGYDKGWVMGKQTEAIVNRLKRIEGQVRGVAQMVSDERYCIDVLHQVQAIKSALARVESEILKDHAACCVSEAIASGDVDQQRAKFGELIDLIEKVKR